MQDISSSPLVGLEIHIIKSVHVLPLSSFFINQIHVLLSVFVHTRYLQQFQDLYTEEGRKSVKICSYIPHTARVGSQPVQQPQPTTTQAAAVTGISSSASNAEQPSRTFVSSSSATAANGHSAAPSGLQPVSMGPSNAASSHPQHSVVQTTPSLSTMRTYGQKLALFQQQQQQQQASAISSTQYITVSSPSVPTPVSLAGVATKAGTGEFHK